MMNKNKLKELVGALDALSDDIKDMKVDMGSTSKPSCDTCGCHAGLISIVAKDLPELQETYRHLCSLHLEKEYYNNPYVYIFWARALADFLDFEDRYSFIYWAGDNPEIWGNEHGVSMFDSAKAFTDDESKQITHRDLINHWKQVLVNIEREIKRR
ncbi:hypothetical protein [uncultured Gammaproteobacteria bacterium]|nr:hypothetical protein [uncultured Gammaproteobacteria bacterium]CAC9992272.1 hypothetical protein [uncultured Gammaproteobacteria bacterium]